MKQNKTFLRCLAFVLALVLILTNANLGMALTAFAAGEDKNVTVGRMLADTDSYNLTEAEKMLIASGLLKGDATYTYSVPGNEDDLVTIDPANKTITVGTYGEWTPVKVELEVENTVVETIDTFVNGVATYTTEAEAFVAKVTLALNYEVEENVQKTMLHTAAYLKEGLKSLTDVKGTEVSLETVEGAIGTLETIISTLENNYVTVSDSFKNAVTELSNQVTEHGMLTLRKLNAEYQDGTKYLMANAGIWKKAVLKTYDALNAIAADELCNNGLVDYTLKTKDPASYNLWVGFRDGVMKDLLSALKPVTEAGWQVADMDLLKDAMTDDEYTLLDLLVGNIATVTEVASIKTTMHIADAEVLASRALINVTVKVALKVVENKIDSDKLVTYGTEKTVVLGLKEGATAAEILAAVEAKGVVAEAKAAWGKAYVAEHYVEAASELPSKLAEDIVYTVTYTPATYAVTMNGEAYANYPYGYQMTLPIHTDVANHAYDYTVNGEDYVQGDVITIAGKTDITRTVGAAYTKDSLYEIIGNSFGNKAAQDILSSGALKGDAAVNYRVPTVAEGDMSLKDGLLTVKAAYASSYHGLEWKPYTYGVKGDENKFTGNTASWNGNVIVRYALHLDTDEDKVRDVVALVKTLSEQYDAQKAGMESLLSQKSEIEALPRTYMAGLNGMLDLYFGDKGQPEMAEYFISIITAMLDKEHGCFDGAYMAILNMIKGYEANGMEYYYQNSEVIRAEVLELSGYLTGLVGNEERKAALYEFLSASEADGGMARPDLAEKIGNLEETMARIASQMIITHESIDVNSANLSKLIDALGAETAPSMTYTAGQAPFVVSADILVEDESKVALFADITVDGVSYTVWTDGVLKGTKLTANMVSELQKKIDDVLAEHVGDKTKYYNITSTVSTLNALVGTELTSSQRVAVTADAKQYTVKINGEADQIITINNPKVNLPAYDDGTDLVTIVNVYFVDGVELPTEQRTYTFSAAELDKLFTNGTYTITRTQRNEAESKLNDALNKLNDNDAGNTYKMVDGVLYANVSATGAGLEAFAMGLLGSGYSYIGMNGEAFMYENADAALELSIQALLNAMLNDNTFGSQTLINLGQNNGGKVLTTNLQLGEDADTLYENKMGFVLTLNSVPAQMTTLANYMDAVKDYVSFQSNNGVLDISLNLPEKVYEVYLTALLAAGEVDTDDMNAVDNKIAFMFLYDYVDLILGNDNITTETFQNTLEIMDAAAGLLNKDLPNKDLTAYEDGYQLIREIYKSIEVVVVDEAPVSVTANATTDGLMKVINALGIDLSAYNTYLTMVRELNGKHEGTVLTATAHAVLENTAVDFEALIVDLDAGVEGAKDAVDAVKNGGVKGEVKDNLAGKGLANAIDYTTNLVGRVSEVTGPAAIYLLSDVKGDLVIRHTTILDLNGKTIDGNITVESGELYIVDSKIAHTDCGGVTGKITGDVNIVAGNYKTDVSAYLKDGYKQVDGTVQNAMYTIEREGKNFILVLNSDFMEDACVEGYLPSVRYLAAEIAIDMAMNFYIPANLNIEDNRIYGIDDRYADLIGLIKNDLTVGKAADLILEGVSASGIAAFANQIIDDLMQFGAIADAIDNEELLCSYDLATNPWAVEILHVEGEDYMSFGVVADDEVAIDATLSLKIVGDNAKALVALLRELDRIVVYEETGASVAVKRPVRDGKTIILEGGANASLSLDLTVHGEDGFFGDDDYKNILAVIFAYGNPAKAETLVNAIGDDEDLRAAFNDMTVREIIKSLDAMSRTVSFTEMAEAVGAADLMSSTADDLEGLYHLIACGAGKVLGKLESMNINGVVDRAENVAEKVLEKLNLTTLKKVVDKAGNVLETVIEKVDLDSKLGALDQGDGTYILQYTYSRSGDVEYRGFGADMTLTELSGMLKVKVFEDETCLWGDANHDNEVNAKDATLVLQYSLNILPEGQFFCTLRTDVNGDGEINAKDATLILQHSLGNIEKFPAEN